MSTRLGRFVVTGTAAQVGAVQTALAGCRYPVAERLPRDIPVTFADLTRYSALGLFWTAGRIEVEQSLPADRAAAVFLAEAWHAVDQYVLTSGDRASLLTAAHPAGPDGHTWFNNNSYYDQLGETTMDVFLAAFTDYPPTGINWSHPVTAAMVDRMRQILGATTPPVPPTPPPAPPTPPPAPPAPPAPPVDPDRVFAAAAHTFLTFRHYAKNVRAFEKPVREWLSAKGL